MHAIVFRVGEGNRNARVQEFMQAGGRKVAGGDTHMVFGNCFSILWSY